MKVELKKNLKKRTGCSFCSACKLLFSAQQTYPWWSRWPCSIPLQFGMPGQPERVPQCAHSSRPGQVSPWVAARWLIAGLLKKPGKCSAPNNCCSYQ